LRRRSGTPDVLPEPDVGMILPRYTKNLMAAPKNKRSGRSGALIPDAALTEAPIHCARQ
jgi:hypothetical protein